MAMISGLTDRQRERFKALRESGQGNKAKAFKQKALAEQRGPGVGPDGKVKLGPEMSKQLAQESAYGQSLIDKFVPDISVLGTLDASRSDEVQNLINQQSAFAGAAGTRSDDVQAGIDLAKQGLGGLTAAENDALRAQAYQGMNQGFLGQQRALANAQSRAGVTGAAGAAQYRTLAQDQFQQERGLQNDILLNNIAIQDQRRNALNNLLQTVEGREFSQQNTALGGLQNLVGGARADELNREQFNLLQNEKLLAAQQGLYFGGQGIIQAKRNALENARRAKQQEAAALANANAQAQAAALAAQQQQALIASMNLPSLGGGGGVI